jgi:tetratricopeptide (TPR) repeat protein
MKKLFFTLSVFASTSLVAQLEAPKLSPEAEVEQVVGITEIEVDYSRPAKRDRVVFGDVVPFGEIWRTGANANSTIETDQALNFSGKSLPAGKYAIYTKPEKKQWTVYFYTKSDNSGLPKEWKQEEIALELIVPALKNKTMMENFTIYFDKVTIKSAVLTLAWDKVRVEVPFTVNTQEQMEARIEEAMKDADANDYYRAADYYFNENIHLEKALEYINKSLEMREEVPFWMLRKKSLIEAGLGKYQDAIKTAEESLKLAEAAGNATYVDMNRSSIEEWKKK